MLVRNLLLIAGTLAILVGVSIGTYLWLSPRPAAPTRRADTSRALVLVATRAVPSGSVVRDADLTWKALETQTPPPGSLARGQVSVAELVGSVTRRDLAAGELVMKNTLIERDDSKGLAALLSPGYRAVTIDVDAAQSGAGLILPDDRVDVILVSQTAEGPPGSPNAARRSQATPVLRDIRVVAVDRAIDRPSDPAGKSGQKPPDPIAAGPKTIALEVTERDAERLLRATQMGKIELSLRSLARGSEPDGDRASDTAGTSDQWAPMKVSARRRPLRTRPGRTNPSGSGMAGGGAIVFVRGSTAVAR